MSLSTVEHVLNQHGLKGRSARKKPLLKKKQIVQSQIADLTSPQGRRASSLRSDESKAKPFGHNEYGDTCTILTVRYGGERILLKGRFVAGETAASHKINGNMMEEH